MKVSHLFPFHPFGENHAGTSAHEFRETLCVCVGGWVCERSQGTRAVGQWLMHNDNWTVFGVWSVCASLSVAITLPCRGEMPVE